MKVLYVTNLPAPYKVAFFNELSRFVELTVVYERATATNRDKQWKADEESNFETIYLASGNIGEESSCSTGVIRVLKKRQFDTVIMNGFSSLTAIFTIAYMRRKKIPYGVMCDGMLPGKGNGLKTALKRYLLAKAQYCLSSNQITEEVLEGLGVSDEKIFPYPFSSVSQKDIQVDMYEKAEYKKIVGAKKKKMLLFVGQFIHRKGLDVLLRAFEELERTDTTIDVELVLAGGTELPYSVPENIRDRVTVIGFKKGEQLRNYYKAADALVLSTREDIWGLVVNEAFAVGTPVITTERCGAGLAMVEDETMGAIVPVEDVVALQRQLHRIVADECGYSRETIVEKALEYTIENMAGKTFAVLQTVVEGRN